MNQTKFDRKYHTRYFENSVSPRAASSAPEIARGIIDTFRDTASIVDVGCGAGDLLAEFMSRGRYTTGFERAAAALELCRRKGLVVIPLDLESAHYGMVHRHDVAICMEVAEHVSAGAADSLVYLLSKLSERVVFTAAHPGQGGNGHVNEQAPEYWIEKFARRNLVHDSYTSRKLSQRWSQSGSVVSWYWQNLMVFRKLSPDSLHSASHDRTICEVLREIHDLHDDDPTRALLLDAVDMAKRMARKLSQYNREEFGEWWADNEDYAEDLARRTGEESI